MRVARTIARSFALVAALAFAQEGALGPPPGRLIDIGGHKLHLLCSGSGSPAVILEAGASSFAIDWALVQPEIARTNRVCAYDRAGMGFSDPPPSGGADVIADLHRALEVADEKPPYVLVGASRGGLYVRLFADRHPAEVVGIVLVDAASEDRLFTMFEGKAVEIAALTAEQLRSNIPRQAVTVPRRSPQAGAPFDRLPRELYELRIKLDTKLIASIPESVPYEAVAAGTERERAQLARLKETRTARPQPLGDRPVVVLTRGDSSQELRGVHARLAGLSANSRHTVVADSGHEIHLYRPDVVIQAIRDVLEASRNKKKMAAR